MLNNVLLRTKNKKIKKNCLTFFIGKSCFSDYGSQNCLIFQSLYDILNKLTGTERIMGWKS